MSDRKRATIELSSGQVWVSATKARRIIAVMPSGPLGIVVYSVGGDSNRITSKVAMRVWIRKRGATLASKERVDSFALALTS